MPNIINTLSIDEQLELIYVGYFGRAAESNGFDFWRGENLRAQAAGSTAENALKNIANSFAPQPETAALFPFASTTLQTPVTNPAILDQIRVLVESVYQNLFNRPSDPEGLAFWTGQISSGQVLLGEAILTIANGAQEPDQTILNNKIDAAFNFSSVTATNNIGTGSTPLTDALKAAAVAAISGVDETQASVSAAASATSQFVASFVSGSGQTINLTSGVDAPGASPPAANTTGTTSNDTYVGVFDNNGTSTITSSDSLDGAGGTDALNIRVVTHTSNQTISPQSTNVENFVITNQVNSSSGGGGGFILNFAGITGEALVSSKDSIAGSQTAATNVDAATAEMDTAQGLFVVQYNGTRTGTADAFSLALKGAGTVATPAQFATVTTDLTVMDSTFEIVNISSTGAASNVSLLSPIQTVNVAGDAALKLTGNGNFAGLRTIDASAMTAGGLNIDARGTTETSLTFLGGGADDRVIFANTTLNAATTLSLNGGGGKDTLASTSFDVTPSVVNNATGFEVLESVSPSNGLTATDFTSINEFVFSGGPNNGRVNIQGVESSDRFVFSSNQGTGDEAVRFIGATPGSTAVFELRASSETNGEVTITANTNSGNDVSAIGFQGQISSVTIDSTGQNTNANVINSVNNGSFNYFAINNDNGLTNFTITGSQALTITAIAGVNLSDSTKTIGFSESVNVNASAFTGVLRIAGSNSNDVITGGSGNDIIYGLAGSDTLTGNGGADQFRVTGTNGTDVIKDFVKGVDKVGFNTVDFTNTTATSAGAVLALADYVQNRNGVTDMGASDNKKVVELQSELSGAQISTDTGAAIEAYVLVFNSTANKGQLWYDSNWSDAGGRFTIATFDNVTDIVGVRLFSNTDFVEFIA